MKHFKKILAICLLIAISAYLGYKITYLNPKESGLVNSFNDYVGYVSIEIILIVFLYTIVFYIHNQLFVNKDDTDNSM